MDIQSVNINNFNYDLPEERIAKYPLAQRDSSKLLVSNREGIHSSIFNQLPECLDDGILLVINDTKVIRARLHFHKVTGAHIEIFLLEPALPTDYEQMFQTTGSCTWKCLIGNAKKWKDEFLTIDFQHERKPVKFTAEKGEPTDDGNLVTFTWDDTSLSFADIIHTLGELPIPPYLNRRTENSDNETYQTVYSEVKGSVAAPTAGLHFTENVLKNIKNKHIDIAKVTLHVGAGTFRPVKSDDISQHSMHAEHICVTTNTLQALIAHKGEAVAVGTTSVRTLESLYYIGVKIIRQPDIDVQQLQVQQWEPYQYTNEQMPTVIEALQAICHYLEKHHMPALHTTTQIIIMPGYQYHIVKGLVTNFHQPKSTLLLLVSAFIGDRWREVYRYALDNDYRFLSYGDASLLFP